MTSLVLAKYDEGVRLRITTLVTQVMSRQKMKLAGVGEGECLLEQMPKNH